MTAHSRLYTTTRTRRHRLAPTLQIYRVIRYCFLYCASEVDSYQCGNIRYRKAIARNIFAIRKSTI